MNLEGVNYRPNYIQRITGLPVSICLRTICFVSFFLFSFVVSKVNAQSATISVNDNNVCEGATSPILTFNGTGGNPQYVFEYTVNGGGTQTIGPGDNLTINVPTGTPGTITYHLIGVTDNDGGPGGTHVDLDQTINVTINAAPTPDVEITAGSLPLCYDSGNPGAPTVTIRSDITGSAYQWYYTGFPPGPGTQISGATNRSLTLQPGDGGYYTVRVTNTAGCQGFSNAFQVTQMSTPPPINGSHNTTHETECVGFNPGTLNLSGVSGGSGGYTYQWQFSDDGNNWSNIGGATGTSYNPPTLNTPGEYYYRVIITDDCKGTGDTSPKHITINAPPAMPNPSNDGPLCAGETLHLEANVNADSYQWLSSTLGS